MLPILLLALSATPSQPPARPSAAAAVVAAEDFGIEVTEQVRTARGVKLGLSVANRTGAKRLFVHLEPNESDAKTVMFMPSAERDRMTFYLTSDGSETYQATLLFPLEAAATSAVVVVGEAVAPYRQAGKALDLNKAIAPPEPVATPGPVAPPEPEAKPGDRSIARYKPPVAALGEVVLKDGSAGSDGKGWTRIYTDLPDVSLDQIALAIQHPNQIWNGASGMLYIAKTSTAKAIALEVRDGEIIAARMLTKESFPRSVGPGTSFPSRIYVGK